jgi:hypothetical protein
VNLLCLSITLALGYGVIANPAWGSWHQLSGVTATLTCCAIHCIVFTYFIATAKWIRHAIEVKHLDPALAEPTRSFKAQAFPAALCAIFTVFLAAVIGVATLSYQLRPLLHHIAALIALAVNAGSAVLEYRAIRRNATLIDQLLLKINPKRAAG